MRNSTKRFKQIYFPPPVQNRFSVWTFIIGLFNLLDFVPTIPQKWKVFIFIIYCLFLVFMYIRGMIDNNEMLLDKIDALKTENSELKENRDGLVQQYHKHRKEISNLKAQIHDEKNFHLLLSTFLPIEIISELNERRKLLKLGSNEKSDEKDE